jgi:hypothetical protein
MVRRRRARTRLPQPPGLGPTADSHRRPRRSRQPTSSAGSASTRRIVLRAYDLVVLGFSNRFVWRCPSATLLERHDRHVGKRHLDLGVGTGWFVDRCRWPIAQPEITLVDLNENSLSMAARRVRRYAPRTIRANVLEALPLGDARFESVAANYLLHCLPGPIESKAAMLAANVLPHLEPGGVLFGGTILGRGVRHTRLGRRLMRLYNKQGIFSNTDDDEQGLETGLASAMSHVSIEVVGAVAVFTARA